MEGDLKTHQQRRVALDPETVEALGEHLARCRARAEALGLELAEDAFVFSGAPDGSTPLNPGSSTQRYDRLAERLGIDTTLHKLRHYLRDRTHRRWRRRAHGGRPAGRPRHRRRNADRPAPMDPVERATLDPQNPYEKIAAEQDPGPDHLQPRPPSHRRPASGPVRASQHRTS